MGYYYYRSFVVVIVFKSFVEKVFLLVCTFKKILPHCTGLYQYLPELPVVVVVEPAVVEAVAVGLAVVEHFVVAFVVDS